ncbi:phosphoglycerate mutase family protein [Hymenobacter sp. M29]|uniref:Phosphoglycerate mutase family protein n=1 Tax=Hymenobacter mellowenesis TaxID=3063995 RepID=A0ABT9A8I9_9BACT|nr:phosphoglycerate mutase family protein [Hymenobacter sp. M29]MDO7845689.1 phosphoglycerate mutase family protein [Hymenobacter sp. M29]
MTTRLSLSTFLVVALAALGNLLTPGSALAQTNASSSKTKVKPIVTTVYIVRHAEKDSTSDAADPTLSPLGQARALALRQTLEKRHPSALFTTDTKRTRATLEPLAGALKLEPQVYDPRRGRDLADRVLKDYAGKSVVIVGHSNTILSLIDDFGAIPPVEEIGENEYEYLFTVLTAEGMQPIVETRGYGAERKTKTKVKVKSDATAKGMTAPAAPQK